MQQYKAGARVFYLVDAKDKVLGNIASKITPILIGKHKPIYNPFEYDCGDHVVVINSRNIVLTGTKWERKLIRWHTGWTGNLKEYTCEQMHTKDPTDLVRRAVNGMLPKNNIRRKRMERLHVFPDDKHELECQFPIVFDTEKDYVKFEKYY